MLSESFDLPACAAGRARIDRRKRAWSGAGPRWTPGPGAGPVMAACKSGMARGAVDRTVQVWALLITAVAE